MKRDYNSRASTYLKWLGIVNLIGLNLGGLIYLWLAEKITKKSNGARKFLVVWFLIVCPIFGVAIIFASLAAGEPLELKIFSYTQIVSLPIATGFVFLILVIHAIPGVWLSRKDVRDQYFEPGASLNSESLRSSP